MAALSTNPAPLLTTKQVAQLGDLELACGKVLRDVLLGYETYGTLNARRDNAVLICHYFTGTSHAAGRYSLEDKDAGWWDTVVGPGKAIDTDRFFVVAADALGCIRIDAPHGVTTSPRSLDPATGKPYGPTFPAIAIADSVSAQRRLLDQLGVERLHAVAGPSLGAMQALEWAVSRPEEVDRLIAVIGLAEFRAREIGMYRIMADVVRLDPMFQGGGYDPSQPPMDGLGTGLALMTMLSGGRATFDRHFGRRPSDPECDPYVDEEAEWAMESWLEREAKSRASLCDANAWLSMLRTNMRWDLGHQYGSLDEAFARIKARVLLVPAEGDELLAESSYHRPMEVALERAGVEHRVFTLPAAHGHLAGLADIALAAGAIRACMESRQ